MAVVINYYTNYISEEHKAHIHREGPFVVCKYGLGPQSYRVEVRSRTRNCPRLPDCEVYKVCKELGLKMAFGGYYSLEMISATVDTLNQMYLEGELTDDEI